MLLFIAFLGFLLGAFLAAKLSHNERVANIALCVQWYLQQLVSPLPFSSSGVFTENLFLDGPVGSPAPCFISTPHPGVHVCAQLLRSCPALCDPVDCSPASSSVHGILQAGILEWVEIEPASPASFVLQVDSFPPQHQGSPYTQGWWGVLGGCAGLESGQFVAW